MENYIDLSHISTSLVLIWLTMCFSILFICLRPGKCHAESSATILKRRWKDMEQHPASSPGSYCIPHLPESPLSTTFPTLQTCCLQPEHTQPQLRHSSWMLIAHLPSVNRPVIKTSLSIGRGPAPISGHLSASSRLIITVQPGGSLQANLRSCWFLGIWQI